MKKITHWLVRKFVRDYGNVNEMKVRSAYCSLEGWVSIIVNILLFFLKLVLGIWIKSVSLIADAVHTLSDCFTSVVVIIGLRMARKPSDKEHPFGHGRMESVTALVVAVLLFSAAIEVIEKSINRILNPTVSNATAGVILVVAGTIVVKELLARFSFILGDMVGSSALKADGLHHRSDALSTVMVVAALIAVKFGFNNIDGIMGIFVAIIIIYSSYEIAKEAINPLLGEPPSRETLKEIEETAKNYKGVLGVHDIIYNKYGQTNIISLHIEVSDKEIASKLHTLSEAIEEDIAKKLGGMVIVHIDPINRDHPKYEIISFAIKEIIALDEKVNSFHELRIVGTHPEKYNVIFDIALEEGVGEDDADGIITSLAEKLKMKFPLIRVVIKAEPKYVYNL